MEQLMTKNLENVLGVIHRKCEGGRNHISCLFDLLEKNGFTIIISGIIF